MTVRRFENKKTLDVYRLLAEGTDCTNRRDGTAIIVYCPEHQGGVIFIKELAEFYKEFRDIKNGD